MAISQIIWSLDDKEQLQPAELINEKELEDILAEHIEILDADWLLIGRQVRTVAGKFIDLLCMDHDGDLIVVELKKDLTPREVTAQAIDYASCMADLTLDQLAELYLQFSGGTVTLNDAYKSNPESAKAAIDALMTLDAPLHIACLGDMLDLGPKEVCLHEEIGDYAFALNRELANITFSSTLQTIGDYAFYDNRAYFELTLPNEVSSIGQYAFARGYSFVKINIPDSVQTIGESAFYREEAANHVDPEFTVESAAGAGEALYESRLNMRGGRVSGCEIASTDAMKRAFEKLASDSEKVYGSPLLFLVGDGNHSLATAKASWEKIREGLPEERRKTHPARYALCEAVNIYDAGIRFEAIHRIVKGVDANAFAKDFP